MGQYRGPWHMGRVGIDPTGEEHGDGTPERVPRMAPLLRERGRKKLNGVWGEPPRTPSVLTPLDTTVVPLAGGGSTAGSRAIIQVSRKWLFL